MPTSSPHIHPETQKKYWKIYYALHALTSCSTNQLHCNSFLSPPVPAREKSAIKNFFSRRIYLDFMKELNPYRHMFPPSVVLIRVRKIAIERNINEKPMPFINIARLTPLFPANQMNYDYYIRSHVGSSCLGNIFHKIYGDHHWPLTQTFAERNKFVNIIPTNYTKLTG